MENASLSHNVPFERRIQTLVALTIAAHRDQRDWTRSELEVRMSEAALETGLRSGGHRFVFGKPKSTGHFASGPPLKRSRAEETSNIGPSASSAALMSSTSVVRTQLAGRDRLAQLEPCQRTRHVTSSGHGTLESWRASCRPHCRREAPSSEHLALPRHRRLCD